MLGNLLLGTLAWEPLLGNLFLGTLPGTSSSNLFLGTLLGNLLLGTLAWEPVPGNLAWEPCLGTLLGTSSWEPCLGTLLGNLAWEPVPGNLVWEPLAGNPCLGTCSWEPLGNLTWEPVPGNLAWKPCLGTSSWEPCYLRRADLAAPRDSLGKGDPSPEPGSQPCAVRIWLLRPAPEPLLWLKTPSLRCWGNKYEQSKGVHSLGVLTYQA